MILKWTATHQHAFGNIKMTKELILTYLKFDEILEIHTNASDQQLGQVISTNGMPLAFYSRK